MESKSCGACKWFGKNEVDDGCQAIGVKSHFSADCKNFERLYVPTNGDKLRSMSNEEMAELFALSAICATCPMKDVECIGDGKTERTYAHCYDKFLSFFNAPAESEVKDGC